MSRARVAQLIKFGAGNPPPKELLETYSAIRSHQGWWVGDLNRKQWKFQRKIIKEQRKLGTGYIPVSQ